MCGKIRLPIFFTSLCHPFSSFSLTSFSLSLMSVVSTQSKRSAMRPTSSLSTSQHHHHHHHHHHNDTNSTLDVQSTQSRQRQSKKDEVNFMPMVLLLDISNCLGIPQAIRKKIEQELSKKRGGSTRIRQTKKIAGTVSALRPTQALTVRETLLVMEAAQLMAAKRSDCVLVIDEEDHLSGIFTVMYYVLHVKKQQTDPYVNIGQGSCISSGSFSHGCTVSRQYNTNLAFCGMI